MASQRVIDFQLVGELGQNIGVAGGEVMICTQGSPDKLTLTDLDGGALSNPVSLSRGRCFATVPKANTAVDLFIRSPTGHFRAWKNFRPGESQSVHIPVRDDRTTYVVPFSITDAVANTEKDSGFDLATDAIVEPHAAAIDVTTADSGMTIDVGILSSESGGDADGFIDGVSLTSAATVVATNTVTVGSNESYLASTTLGVLLNTFLAGADVAGDVGTSSLKGYRCNGTAKSISYTLSTSTDTGKGYILLPVNLAGAMATASSPYA